MVALGIAADYLSTRMTDGPLADVPVAEVREKINAMHALLDAALAPQERLF
jgi:cell division protein ZapA